MCAVHFSVIVIDGRKHHSHTAISRDKKLWIVSKGVHVWNVKNILTVYLLFHRLFCGIKLLVSEVDGVTYRCHSTLGENQHLRHPQLMDVFTRRGRHAKQPPHNTRQDEGQTMNPQSLFHASTSWASYGVSFCGQFGEKRSCYEWVQLYYNHLLVYFHGILSFICMGAASFGHTLHIKMSSC